MMSALAFIILLGAWIASASAEPIVGSAPQKVADAFVPHPLGYRAVPWVQGLEVPWSLIFLPDGRALVSERPGRIRLIRDGVLQEEPYAVLAAVEGGKGLIGFILELAVGGEGGLMGLALHPDFPEEPYVYAMHTYRGPDGVKNRVMRLEDRDDHGRFDKVIRFFDVSNGIEEVSERGGDQVDHGDVGGGVSVSACLCPSGLEETVEALHAGVAVA